jgi:hypothetical protein
MLTTELTRKELEFMSQSDIFLDLYLKEKGLSDLSEVEPITARLPFPLDPVLVEDFRNLQNSERAQIVESYNTFGLAHLIALNPDDKPNSTHPLLDICDQLKDDLHFHHPLQHPHENHPEANSRFGADGTVKIYDLPKPIGGATYREQAETSEAFEAHTDGPGTAGRIQTVVLYVDSPPLFGGFTCFYDILALGVALAQVDMEAFRSLFLPDAFTALRPRGKGGIKVVTPILFINEDGKPQAFFRRSSGEYKMIWRSGYAPLERAREFLHTYTRAFSLGSFFIPSTQRGQMYLSKYHLAHGRTPFVDGPHPNQRRVLSRKWYMTAAEHCVHRRVPGMALRADYAALFPELFGEDKLVGDWIYDPESDMNRLRN